MRKVNRLFAARRCHSPKAQISASTLTAPKLSQPEGGAAYNLSVDDDVHAIGAEHRCLDNEPVINESHSSQLFCVRE